MRHSDGAVKKEERNEKGQTRGRATCREGAHRQTPTILNERNDVEREMDGKKRKKGEKKKNHSINQGVLRMQEKGNRKTHDTTHKTRREEKRRRGKQRRGQHYEKRREKASRMRVARVRSGGGLGGGSGGVLRGVGGGRLRCCCCWGAGGGRAR